MVRVNQLPVEGELSSYNFIELIEWRPMSKFISRTYSGTAFGHNRINLLRIQEESCIILKATCCQRRYDLFPRKNKNKNETEIIYDQLK